MSTISSSTFRCPRLVGRERELERLATVFADPAAAVTVAVAGEAGIGKSRLVEEAVATSAGGWRVVRAACFEPDAAVPYALIVDLLRDLSLHGDDELAVGADELLSRLRADTAHTAGEGPPGSDAPAELVHRRYAQDLARVLLGASDVPTLVVVEDLHWVDEASLATLLHVARRFGGRAATILATHRTGNLSRALTRLLAELERAHLSMNVELAPLGEDEVAEVVRTSLGLDRAVRRGFISFLTQLSGGNPLHVEELLGGLVAEADDREVDRLSLPITDVRIPLSVADTTARRLQALDEDARRAVGRAAVIGRRVDLDLLAAVLDVSEPAALDATIDELVAVGLLDPVGAGRVAFRHELTRRAVLAELAVSERRAVHREIAKILTDQAATDPNFVFDLATHAYEAGEWTTAAEAGSRAGDQALTLHEPRAALTHLARAVDATVRAGRTPDPDLLRARARAHELLGDLDAAREDLTTALGQVRDSDGPHARRTEVRLLLQLGEVLTAGDYQAAGGRFSQALDLARDLDDPELIARACNRLGNWVQNRGDDARALQLHSEALSIFEDLDDARGLAATHDHLGLAALSRGELSAARTHHRRAVGLLRRLDDRVRLVTALGVLSLTGGTQMGDVFVPAAPLADCVSLAMEALELARQLDWPTGEAFAAGNLGAVYAAQGRFGDAETLLTGALELARDLDHRAFIQRTIYFLATLRRDLLELEAAAELGREALAVARQAGLTLFLGPTAAELVCVLARLGQLEEARTTLELARDETEHRARTSAMNRGQFDAARAELELARDEPLAALAAIDELVTTAGDAGAVVPRPWRGCRAGRWTRPGAPRRPRPCCVRGPERPPATARSRPAGNCSPR